MPAEKVPALDQTSEPPRPDLAAATPLDPQILSGSNGHGEGSAPQSSDLPNDDRSLRAPVVGASAHSSATHDAGDSVERQGENAGTGAKDEASVENVLQLAKASPAVAITTPVVVPGVSLQPPLDQPAPDVASNASAMPGTSEPASGQSPEASPAATPSAGTHEAASPPGSALPPGAANGASANNVASEVGGQKADSQTAGAVGAAIGAAVGSDSNNVVIVTGAGAGAQPQAGPTPGCFEIVLYDEAERAAQKLAKGAFYLRLDAGTTANTCPDEQAALAFQAERVLEALGTLSPARKEDVAIYYARLQRIAEIGLTGKNARPGLAARRLDALKEEIVRQEAPSVKTKYMSKLGWVAGMVAAPALLVGATTRIIERYEPALAKGGRWPLLVPKKAGLLSYDQTACGALLIASAAFGAWLSFGVRREEFEFENLLVLEEDYLGPKTRITYAVALTLVMALFFHTGIVALSVGGVGTQQVFEKPVVAIVLGLLCGFSEKAVSRLIANTAGRFFKANSSEDNTSGSDVAKGDTTVEVVNVKNEGVGGRGSDAGGASPKTPTPSPPVGVPVS